MVRLFVFIKKLVIELITFLVTWAVVSTLLFYVFFQPPKKMDTTRFYICAYDLSDSSLRKELSRPVLLTKYKESPSNFKLCVKEHATEYNISTFFDFSRVVGSDNEWQYREDSDSFASPLIYRYRLIKQHDNIEIKPLWQKSSGQAAWLISIFSGFFLAAISLGAIDLRRKRKLEVSSITDDR